PSHTPAIHLAQSRSVHGNIRKDPSTSSSTPPARHAHTRPHTPAPPTPATPGSGPAAPPPPATAALMPPPQQPSSLYHDTATATETARHHAHSLLHVLRRTLVAPDSAPV